MATVTAFIRTLKTDKNKPVNVRFRLRDGRDFQIFHKSELSVFPEKWDEKQQKIKARCIIDELERKTFDTNVNDRKALIKSIYLSKGKLLTSELLFTEIDKALRPEKYETKHEITTLFQFIDKFIKEAPSRREKKSLRLLSYRSIQKYRTTERHLHEFAKGLGKKDFEFSEIDKDFYDKFVSYLQNDITVAEDGKVKVLKEQFMTNTVGKHIQVLKLWLNEAQEKGLYNIPNLQKVFYVSSEDVDNVYLNETELQQLKDADLSKIQHLDRVRDWFLLLAWTGSRFSDLSKIAKNNIKNGFIKFNQQKTNEPVTIPLHPVVDEILGKYNFNLPEPITNQRFNEYIKEACRIAEISTPETTTRTIGGTLVTEKFEKWELVTSHTGRRSFCTNMYKRGLPTLMIMKISGHTTEKSFLKYIKVTKDENAEMMKKAWENMYQ